MVKKALAPFRRRRSRGETRQRESRIVFRLHVNLRNALNFLSDSDNRTLSQYVEMVLLEHCRVKLTNKFARNGAPETPTDAGPPWRLRRLSRGITPPPPRFDESDLEPPE